ncbi:MAG: transglutaminase domain-containing protein [Hominenteromicrobium sp.]
MKELHFVYRMKLDFETPVEKHRFTLKCIPRSDERQRIEDLQVEVYPKEFLSEGEDSFGNSCIYGYSEGRHDHFSVRAAGKAVTGLAPWQTEPAPQRAALFKYQTPHTEPGPCIRSFYERCAAASDAAPLDRAMTFMTALHADFRYVQGATCVETTAEQAMALGCGVCQDYAHILLSLCRMAHIPARYAVGMLTGEGLSHAWVEILSGSHWIALDPTNNLVVSDRHIRISSGRDYKDCMINHGIFTGQTVQHQEIQVLVQEAGKEL